MRLIVVTFISMISFYTTARQFVSLKSSEINLRVGPGKEYPISWVFMKSNLPMILVAEFNQWRKIRFVDQTEGWVHQNMVSRKNTAIVVPKNLQYAILYKYSSELQPILKLEQNVIVKVLKKDNEFVKVEVNKIKGWIKKQDLWGINDG